MRRCINTRNWRRYKKRIEKKLIKEANKSIGNICTDRKKTQQKLRNWNRKTTVRINKQDCTREDLDIGTNWKPQEGKRISSNSTPPQKKTKNHQKKDKNEIKQAKKNKKQTPNTIRINYIKAKINNTQQYSKCRLYGERDESHIVTQCSKLAQKKYRTRHDWVWKVIHKELCKKLKFDHIVFLKSSLTQPNNSIYACTFLFNNKIVIPLRNLNRNTKPGREIEPPIRYIEQPISKKETFEMVYLAFTSSLIATWQVVLKVWFGWAGFMAYQPL